MAIYGVAMIAHFWAFANSALNIQSGQRLFPLFLAAASLGGLAGAELTSRLLDRAGIDGHLALGSILLAVTALLPGPAADRLPAAARSTALPSTTPPPPGLGGIGVVLNSR